MILVQIGSLIFASMLAIFSFLTRDEGYGGASLLFGAFSALVFVSFVSSFYA